MCPHKAAKFMTLYCFRVSWRKFSIKFIFATFSHLTVWKKNLHVLRENFDIEELVTSREFFLLFFEISSFSDAASCCESCLSPARKNRERNERNEKLLIARHENEKRSENIPFEVRANLPISNSPNEILRGNPSTQEQHQHHPFSSRILDPPDTTQRTHKSFVCEKDDFLLKLRGISIKYRYTDRRLVFATASRKRQLVDLFHCIFTSNYWSQWASYHLRKLFIRDSR